MLPEMIWPWVWEIGLHMKPEWRIRRAAAKYCAMGVTFLVIGQLSGMQMDHNIRTLPWYE